MVNFVFQDSILREDSEKTACFCELASRNELVMILYDVGMINAGHGLKRNDTAPKLKMKPEK